MAKISIVVPVYNSEKYLNKCIDSLINQTIKDIEIVIVNDGSTDNSQKIIDEYAQKYPSKIKKFYKENGGQASARNLGIKNATGEFIAFVDVDDYVELDTYEGIVEEMMNKNLDIVCFDFYEIVGDEKKEFNHYFFNGIDVDKKYIVSESSPCNKVIRRSLIVDNEIYFLENRIYEDLATIPVLGKYTSKIKFLDKRLYYYVIHSNSTMRQVSYNRKIEDIFFVVDKLYKDFAETRYVEELEYIYIEHLLHAASLRFLNFKEGEKNIYKISSIMKEKFPKWRKNKYYKKQSWKYKIICNLAYYKNIKLLKLILGGNNG